MFSKTKPTTNDASCKSCKRPLVSVWHVMHRTMTFTIAEAAMERNSEQRDTGSPVDSDSFRPETWIVGQLTAPTWPTTQLQFKVVEDKETCPEMPGKVFHAEKMLSRNHCFHKTCSCAFDCKRPLDSTSCCDAPDGEILQALLWKELWTHGYGYGGAGTVPALYGS